MKETRKLPQGADFRVDSITRDIPIAEEMRGGDHPSAMFKRRLENIS